MSDIHDQEKLDFEEYLGCTIKAVPGERSAFTPDKPFTLESLTAIVDSHPNVDWQDPTDPFCGNGPDMLYIMTHHIDDDMLPYTVEMGYDLAYNMFYFV